MSGLVDSPSTSALQCNDYDSILANRAPADGVLRSRKVGEGSVERCLKRKRGRDGLGDFCLPELITIHVRPL